MPLDTAIATFRAQLDALPQCVVLAAPKRQPEDELKRAVRDILEGGDDPVYSDGIESIDRAEIVDGAIEGEFSDRIGVRSIKRVGFKITPKAIETWLLNPDEVAKFSFYQGEVLALFRMGKSKKCAKGHICGRTCIARAKVCRKVPNPETKAKIEAALGGSGIALAHVSPALDKRNAEIRAIAGDAAVDAAEARMKEIFDQSDLYIRCKPETVDRILESGRLKSQFETMSSGGTLDTATRETVERRIMAYPSSTKPEDRPIYGYWADAGKHNDTAAEYYGEVVVRLTPEARQRSTFVAEDSLASELLASAGNNPHIGAMKDNEFNMDSLELQKVSDDKIKGQVEAIANARSMADLRAAWGTFTYIEAQVHGQVGLKDIAEIIYTDGSRPSELAKSKGIKISVK
jgi:Protein of unknown function (DUF3626)